MTAADEPPHAAADELFEAELDARGFDYEVVEDGLYEIVAGEITLTVSLENMRRDYARDNDPGVVSRFAEQLDAAISGETPDWESVQPFIRYSLEPADYEMGFDDVLHEPVTETLIKVYVFTPPDGSSIAWIIDSMLTDWGVTRDEVIEQANQNMDQLVAETKLEIDEIEAVKLGMLATEETPFKASLILSPKFRELVSPTLGWPVFVVAPTRDFAYVLSCEDKDFLGRLGQVVLDEYNESGHPITAEVLEVSDDGVVAIGSFAPRSP
ncbi:MAG: hypothetical protein JWN70_2041 [Planctomycetaceae bacterium]|nr:hypothetical protein [Planctomycetaceae bacterium]